MDWSRPISARVRVLSPFALAATALIPRAALAVDPTTPQKTTRNESPADDPLTSLLSLAPIELADSADGAQIATFADMAAQLAAGDIEFPDSIEDEEAFTRWIHASYPIAIADPMRSYAKVLDRALLGFDVTDLHQTLEAGQPPEMITLLRGRMDRAAVEAAWEANGYELLEVGGQQAASISPDGSFSIENELQSLVLNRMNNAAFLPDGTLAYAPTLALLERVIAVANGDGESLADRIDIAATLASLDQPLASAVLVGGDALSLAAQLPIDLATVTPDLELGDPMPPLAFAIIGITPGGPTLIYDEDKEPLIEMPPATIVYRVLMVQPGTAAEAAEIADERLGTLSSLVSRFPLTDLFADWDARGIEGDDILAIDLEPAEGRPITFWIQQLFARDLLFLAW